MVLPSGAQRLAASVVWQGSKCFFAFRKAYECSTPCGISGLAGYSQAHHSTHPAIVLKRLAASVVLAGTRPANSVGLPERCSTPCGISGFGRWANDIRNVLIEECSTPCGISGLAGRLPLLPKCLHRLCSTPCGISGLAGPWPSHLARTRVLSAQRLGRHQWFGRLEYPNPQQCYECLCSTPLRHQWFGRNARSRVIGA